MIKKFVHYHPKIKTINFMIFVDMIVRSLDFKCEGVLNIYEFISYEKEKKSNKSCLNLSSCG
jgi:hypothetical protein